MLPGDDTGVVKHTCGNESSYLMCPQLQPPKLYHMCPNYMKEAQKDYKVLSHEDVSQIRQRGNNIARHLSKANGRVVHRKGFAKTYSTNVVEGA